MARIMLLMAIFLFSGGCIRLTPESPVPVVRLTKEINGEKLAEGAYATPSEVSGFSGTILELKNREFRYWFYSDVVSLNDPQNYPVNGKYQFQNGELKLEDAKGVNQAKWTVDVVNGTPVLWRDDALKMWKEEGKFYDYGILIWVGNESANDDATNVTRRSIRDLYSKSKQKEVKEWKDPFVHGSQ